jgi:hypothetical protein
MYPPIRHSCSCPKPIPPDDIVYSSVKIDNFFVEVLSNAATNIRNMEHANSIRLRDEMALALNRFFENRNKERRFFIFKPKVLDRAEMADTISKAMNSWLAGTSYTTHPVNAIINRMKLGMKDYSRLINAIKEVFDVDYPVDLLANQALVTEHKERTEILEMWRAIKKLREESPDIQPEVSIRANVMNVIAKYSHGT